jgi:hypothetical protein
MSENTLDYQTPKPPHRKPWRETRRFLWVVLFMLFPTLLLLSAVACMLIYSGFFPAR